MSGSLASPAHRASLRFLRGGLVAIVALLIPSQFGFVTRDSPALAWVATAGRLTIPAIGFAVGGAIGGTALGRGRRGVLASAAAFLVIGACLSWLAPPLQGLTGFEDLLLVIAFAALATGGSFAAGGLVMGLLLRRRQDAGGTRNTRGAWAASQLALGFGLGGAVGGVVGVLPASLAGALGAWPSEAQLFVRLVCSLAGLLGPFAVAGAVAGRAVGHG